MDVRGEERRDSFGDPVSPGTRPITPRLEELIRLVQAMDDAEFRRLPSILSDLILARERERARRLARHLGERCDVIWPGQAEAWDVCLVAADVAAGTARVEYSPGGRGLDVPACCVVIREG